MHVAVNGLSHLKERPHCRESRSSQIASAESGARAPCLAGCRGLAPELPNLNVTIICTPVAPRSLEIASIERLRLSARAQLGRVLVEPDKSSLVAGQQEICKRQRRQRWLSLRESGALKSMRGWRPGKPAARLPPADGAPSTSPLGEAEVEMVAQRQEGAGGITTTTGSAITAQSSHVGDASIADSTTPLVKMASSELSLASSSAPSNKAHLQVPAVVYHSPASQGVARGPASPAGFDDKPIVATGFRNIADAPRSNKRRLFKAPISTVTSSVLASRPRRKRTDTDDAFTANSQTTGSVSSKTAVTEPGSPGSAGTEVDRQLGHNDGKGNEGVLRRVYDTWALTSLGVANIGPVAGQYSWHALMRDLCRYLLSAGAFFGVHTAKEYGGYGMLSIGWPLSGLFMCIFSAVLAEISSSYPVAGAM